MEIHYSATIKDEVLAFHGVVNFPRATPKHIPGNEKNITESCKSSFIGLCKRKNLDHTKLLVFEVYYFDNDGEVPIFKWNKKWNYISTKKT